MTKTALFADTKKPHAAKMRKKAGGKDKVKGEKPGRGKRAGKKVAGKRKKKREREECKR